jgi:hypothetical protein
MDIQIRKQLEQLEYIKDKLEYIEYSESLQCYVEKLNGIPTGVAAWVNGAFYGFEQAAKAQAVQSKQDLIDRVNARWQLAHEQCAENWNTYSSAQMDAFDWVEQDIKELLGEAQEPAND